MVYRAAVYALACACAVAFSVAVAFAIGIPVQAFMRWFIAQLTEEQLFGAFVVWVGVVGLFVGWSLGVDRRIRERDDDR